MSNWLKAKNNGSKSRDKSNGDGKMEFHKSEWNRDENRQRIAWRRGEKTRQRVERFGNRGADK